MRMLMSTKAITIMVVAPTANVAIGLIEDDLPEDVTVNQVEAKPLGGPEYAKMIQDYIKASADMSIPGAPEPWSEWPELAVWMVTVSYSRVVDWAPISPA